MRATRALLASTMTLACGSLPALSATPAATAGPPTTAAPTSHAEAFARGPFMEQARLSPDGKALAFINSQGDTRRLVVRVGQGAGTLQAPLRDADGARLESCDWKTPQRLLCTFTGTGMLDGRAFPFNRLVAVNIDGSGMRQLITNSKYTANQFLADVIDWLPDDPDHVLVAVVEPDAGDWPSVMELDVNTGAVRRLIRGVSPLRYFITDTAGRVRIGCGRKQAQFICKRREENGSWRELTKTEIFGAGDDLVPVAMAADGKSFYGYASHEGRTALWQVDLADRDEARVLFSHPQVDVGSPLLGPRGELRAVQYVDDKPRLKVLDPQLASTVAAVQREYPGHGVTVGDPRNDGRVQLLLAESDINGGTFVLVDTQAQTVYRIGNYTDKLPPLARMEPVTVKARDGVAIPGYLTRPVTPLGTPPPLVVLPHGGPILRDVWGYDPLVQLLAAQGYAVLQANFRGSGGYGDDWQEAAHQDWGGLTYDDIVDATRWAHAAGHGDPARTCIVGWSFGGYAALLGGVRDSGLYRCVAAIAPVTDLPKLIASEGFFGLREVTRRQIGNDPAKLERDSPARNAASLKVPVLLVHGKRDYTVPVQQTELMAKELKRAGRPAQLLMLPQGEHSLLRPSERLALYTALEEFLARHLATAATPAAGTP